MTGFIEQLGQALLLCIGIAWSIMVFVHTITFPLNEEKMREIIREEVNKILVEREQ